MTVVIDASLLVSLAANDPRAGAVNDAPPVIQLARKLDRHSAYDAAYLRVTQELQATCWTLDGRLVHNASPLGLPVRLATGG